MLPIPSLLLAAALSAPALALSSAPVLAQDAGYRLPPPAILEVLDAPPPPGVDLSPDGTHMLLVQRPSMPSIAEVAAPWVGLAGIRVDPALHARRTLSFATSLGVRSIANTEVTPLALPEGVRPMSWDWSPNGEHVAVLCATDDGCDLYLASVADGACRRLVRHVNGVLGSPYAFVDGGGALLVRTVPEGAEAPAEPRVPTGPAVQESSGTSSPLRTYQDLLEDPHDEALFAHFATSQLVRVGLDGGAPTKVGPPAMLLGADASPDGRWLLVERLRRPFSYVHPYWRFPHTVEVWDVQRATGAGTDPVTWTVADVPLGEHIPMEGVITGPRSVQWRANAPATLVWCEAQDGGDPAREAELRDIWYARAAPFDGPPDEGERWELARLEERARGLAWLSETNRVLVSEYDRDRRWTRTWLVDLETPRDEPRLLEDRSRNDRYGDPGSPVRALSPFGTTSVVLERDGRILRAGMGHSPEGPRPFLAASPLDGGEPEVLWRSAADRYERFAHLVTPNESLDRIVTIGESADEPANYQLVDLPTGSTIGLTNFEDPTPQLRGIHQELLTYERADGVPLSGTLYLPPGHEEGQVHPLVVWAYPREYSDPSTAGQVTTSTARALRIRGSSHLALLLAGYAVLDGATMPIVGDPETMNDTFLEQIVAASQAAIDACVARGVADADHVVVGGHSYGAFMTANLLAHCDLFRAGIARSGAYNRSLTPFGFQSERRTIWEAPDSYIHLSPFFAADHINEPLLLIHGEKDNNSGTFPIQSERLYAAVKGNGGTVRHVVLPGESHGYQARESALHAVTEMLDWCERFVR